jgi:inhibitor of cysteine peptidase
MEEIVNPKMAFVLGFVALVTTFGCVATPTAVDDPTAYAPATEPSDDGVVEDLAPVAGIEILILESFPVQVQVVARGNLSDGCTTIDGVTQERDGNAFRVTITTVRPVGMECTLELVPFERAIALDVYGLPAGVYTVDVNGVSDTFELAVDNVPQEPPTEPTVVPTDVPTEPPAQGSIGGQVWHDLCQVPYETVDVPPEGCVELPSGGLVANGLLEAGEPGLEGVLVALGAGACPSTGLATANTDAGGMYAFAALDAGTYCVSIDFLDPTNESILIPGSWTYPNPDGATTVTIGAGEDTLDVSFGWDYQFLP